jgi:hypothetical protein
MKFPYIVVKRGAACRTGDVWPAVLMRKGELSGAALRFQAFLTNLHSSPSSESSSSKSSSKSSSLSPSSADIRGSAFWLSY